MRSHFTWAFKPTSGAQKYKIYPWMGSNLALFGPSYEERGHSRPACMHHSAQKHASLSFSTVRVTPPKPDMTRLRQFFQWKQRSDRVLCVCGATSHGPPSPSPVPKHASIPWVGSSLALCVPSYGDKWLPQPACSHHVAENMQTSYVYLSHP